MRRIGRDILSNTSAHAGIRWFKLQYATHVNWAKKWTVRNATMKWIRRDIFCDAIFSKSAQTFWFFDIVGGMCASLWCQSFKTQLHLLPTKILLTGLFWSVRWHMRIWTLKLSEKMKIFLIRVLVYNFNLFYTY